MTTRSKSGPADNRVLYPAALVLLILAVYIPIFRAEATVFDGSPDGWPGARAAHGLNLVVHVLVTTVVYQLGRSLLGRDAPAFLAAVLFAIHPVHVDAVARATSLPHLLAVLAILGGVWLILEFRGSTPLDLSIASAVVAFVLWEWVQRPASANDVSFVENPLVASPFPVRLITGITLLSRSLMLVAWPFRLSADYSYNSIPVISEPFSGAVLLGIVAVAGTGVLAVLWAQRQPLYLLCYGFYMISAFSAINPIFPNQPILAEHYLYFPSIAFCWALAQLLQDTVSLPRLNRKDIRAAKPLAVIILCLVLPWCSKTLVRTGQWRSERLVLESAARTFPRNARVQALLGDLHMREQNYLAAERRYLRALEIYPEYDAAEAGLAAVRRKRDR